MSFRNILSKTILLYVICIFFTPLLACSDWGSQSDVLLDDEIFPFPPNKTCDANNLAVNTSGSGTPSPSESDAGWGEGADKWDIVDGERTYSYWGNGLAFCGGIQRYCNQDCGWRYAVIDFGRTVTVNRVLVWHHNLEHVPYVYKIEYYDSASASYKTAFETTKGRDYMLIKVRSWDDNTEYYERWWEDFSIPVENTFAPVTTSKLRYGLNNCDITHGWLYEIEVYGP